MMYILLLLIFVFDFPVSANEKSYWENISKLSKKGTPEENHNLEKYLNSLTKDQMLMAARQCCLKAEKKVAKNNWMHASIPVSIALYRYGDKKNNLTDKALTKMLYCISNDKESELFRQSLIGILCELYWLQLTDKQKDNAIDILLDVFERENNPEALRILCCKKVESKLKQQYRKIIYADPNIKKSEVKNKKWANIFLLIESKRILLNDESLSKLAKLRERSQEFVKKLEDITKDNKKLPNVQMKARESLRSFSKLPLFEVNK